ncbi:aromatic motif membrane protein [Metamycoplasma neophronis]|uniref:Lipoprotein n=1 Tax=Metamycoplasma neophronis TaxID=872983 RepID=A0ABY2Z1M0_9BACT|nr:aromatic motif membrane protein [Metamycoplasma neophronis]TPR54712.1 hypothetical protein FJR74_00365 [Metamycoplasma neophronis]
MNKKILFISSMPILLAAPAVSISCADYSKTNDFKNIIPKDKDIVRNYENPESENTSKIINDIVNQAFKNNAKKVEFLNDQNNPQTKEKFFADYQSLSNNYLAAKEANLKTQIANQIKNLINQNWYLFLTNIKKFTADFINWFTFPEDKEGRHSEAFKKELANLAAPEPLVFKNDYFDSLKEGDESGELSNTTILYLTKNNAFFRFRITNIRTDSPEVDLSSYVYYFPFSKVKRLSINLISDLMHSAYIHGFQEGFDRYENDLVKKYNYGQMAVMQLLYKGEK